jgi:hypothetical protein
MREQRETLSKKLFKMTKAEIVEYYRQRTLALRNVPVANEGK